MEYCNSCTETNIIKRDPTKLVPYKNINLENYKPTTYESQKTFTFSLIEKLDIQRPEFKFKDYHELIGSIISRKEKNK
jgi:hypothetical protein